jgi:hypothetical protein
MDYTQKEEETQFRTQLFQRLSSQDEELKEIKKDGKETKAQAIKTNGRATALEVKVSDYEKIKDIVIGLSGFKMWLTGAVVASLTVGSGVAYLFMEKIENNTRQIVSEMIEQEKPKIIKSAVEDIITVINQEYNLKIR